MVKIESIALKHFNDRNSVRAKSRGLDISYPNAYQGEIFNKSDRISGQCVP